MMRRSISMRRILSSMMRKRGRDRQQEDDGWGGMGWRSNNSQKQTLSLSEAQQREAKVAPRPRRVKRGSRSAWAWFWHLLRLEPSSRFLTGPYDSRSLLPTFALAMANHRLLLPLSADDPRETRTFPPSSFHLPLGTSLLFLS
jgi:hypothetical protein